MRMRTLATLLTAAGILFCVDRARRGCRCVWPMTEKLCQPDYERGFLTVPNSHASR